VQELKDLRRAGVRTFAEADAYEVEHRRRREASLTIVCSGCRSLMQLVPASRAALADCGTTVRMLF